MLAQVPLSPILAVGVYGGAGIALGAAAVGVALLLWGRYAGRPVFALASAAAGWWAGELVAAQLGVNVVAAQISLAVAGAFLGMVLTPLLWALSAGALVGGAAFYLGILQNQADLLAKAPAAVVSATGDFDLLGFCGAWAGHLWKCTASAAAAEPGKLGFIIGLAGGVPILIGVIRLRLATIVMSALYGSAAIVSGLCVAVGLLLPSTAPVLREHWFVPVVAGCALAPVGVMVQYRRTMKAENDQKNREGEPPEPKKKETA